LESCNYELVGVERLALSRKSLVKVTGKDERRKVRLYDR